MINASSFDSKAPTLSIAQAQTCSDNKKIKKNTIKEVNMRMTFVSV